MSGATPRPWKVRVQNIEGPLGIGLGYCSASMLAGVDGSYSIGRTEAEANAALIVAAVNSYDAHKQSVEALRAILDHPAYLGLHTDDNHCAACRLRIDARAALAAVDKASK